MLPHIRPGPATSPAQAENIIEQESADALAVQRMMLLLAGKHYFALPLGSVREIIPAREFTPLPGSASFVCGMINLRGRIVTVVDLAARLHLPAASSETEHSVVILEHAGKPVGLAVSDVVRIFPVDARDLVASADALRSLRLDRSYVSGVGEIEEGVFVAIDPDEFLHPILL